ncbi:serine/threonine protein kinase [Aliiroseovarius halocynthiae]|uniref:Serine/threonine protein kinase n=1 Tax=Aliiroseovarius halocynthiae TaxID=985055 RepID=A0A545SPC7_9RHOB|nr:serine/threonine-protein kinase [Aliiroseovarius halocynthiae]TQV66835.1 serine/threonine protein kinase [Aliiroseovarius halocynthiae]SMR82328.1 serine/threonine protein kinase [Aliiroseovarius halocynthiae]
MSQNQASGHDVENPQIEALQPGEKLLRGQYEILSFLNNGGFGVTYLARDSLDRNVVIKECFPSALCRRDGSKVEAVDPAYAEDLRSIIDLFIQEARNHARLVHPNIVNVHQVFEDNQTAYIAMDLINGGDLLDYIQDDRNDASPDFIVKVTEKMLSAVSFIHENGMLHRDISPDNILIDEHGEPVLIDFGAAREQAANRSAALLTLRVIKDGYSPHEFYARGADQDETSDLYVLAATLYHAISGERPIDGKSRLDAFNAGRDDPYVPLAGRFAGYPIGFLEALDKAMEVHVVDRVQSALEWLRMFRGPAVVFEEFGYRPSSVIVALERPEDDTRVKTENAEALVTALLASEEDVATAAQSEGLTSSADPDAESSDEPAVTVVKSGSGGSSKAIIGIVALLALAAGGYFAFSGSGSDGGETVEVAEVTPAPVAPAVAEEAEPEVEAVAEPEPVVEEAAPVAEEVVEEPALVEEEATETAAAEPEAVAEETAEEAAPAPVTTDPANLLQNQIAFGHWDVEIPFATSTRRLSIGQAVAITGIDPNRDMSIIGDWVRRGAIIFSVNGKSVTDSASFATRILNDVKVDPDGYIRVAARYRPAGSPRALNGLLALPAIRFFGLENGLTLTGHNADNGDWALQVTRVSDDFKDDLREGDILLSENVTGQQLNAIESLDRVLETLAADGVSQARLTVLRNGGEVQVPMQLAEES